MRMRLAEPTKWDSFTVSAQVLLIWVVTPPPPSFSVSWHTFTSTIPPSPLSTPLMPREACACMPTGTLKPTTPSPNRLHTHTHTCAHTHMCARTRTHTHAVLFLSSHWSVTEATWQVTHTLDVIGSGPEIQPLEWWGTVTCIVYLCYRRGEKGMTQRKQVLLSFFAIYHSRVKGEPRQRVSTFLSTTSNWNSCETLTSEMSFIAYVIIRPIMWVSVKMPAQKRAHGNLE